MKAIILAVSLSIIGTAASAATLDEAIATASRPAADREADARRHPKELLEFAKVKSGDHVVDLMPGHGYFTRLFSAVVGARGEVVAAVPKELEEAKFKPVDSAKEAVAGLKNAKLVVNPLNETLGTRQDLIWTSLNYHDLHTKLFNGADIVAFDKAVFRALKPGGHFVVVDHAAAPGTALSEADRLHRIDPAIVKKEAEAAGFRLEEESQVLAQKDDDHQLPVFDPKIRDKTDQFALRFVKPKK